MKKFLLSVVVGAAMAVVSAQAADLEAGKTKATTVCVACHGPDGNSVNSQWPKLAGQSASFIKKQLMEFKSGARSDPLMSPQAAMLTDEDVENVAAFYPTQKTAAGVAAAAQVELGEKIYRAGNATTGVAACMACHGPAGAGNGPANFPGLAGQHATYVEKALKDFRGGTRANDLNGMMRGVAAAMTDAEITAVAQYVQGLHR